MGVLELVQYVHHHHQLLRGFSFVHYLACIVDGVVDEGDGGEVGGRVRRVDVGAEVGDGRVDHGWLGVDNDGVLPWTSSLPCWLPIHCHLGSLLRFEHLGEMTMLP